MIKADKKTKHGQTSLILILLTAAALIFLAITYNWGHIAQCKSMLTIAADQSASLLASDAASYGEMEKQSNLQDTNEISALSGIIMDIIMIIVVIIILILTICTAGGAAGLFAVVVAVLAVVMAVVNLILQLTVVQPGMCALWNKLQKNQPVLQQFFEGGIGSALQGTVTDQANITDYFDPNTNGRFGVSSGLPNDTVSRFAFFYTDRMKMLNKGDIPQVDFFYKQLGEFMNGESCAQNAIDHQNDPGIPINPICKKMESDLGIDCAVASSSVSAVTPVCETDTYITLPSGAQQFNPLCADTACQVPVPNGFQFNDSCTDSNSGNTSTYNPYCDPCCQPLVYKGKGVRPASCFPYTSPTNYPIVCASKPNSTGCTLTTTCTNNPDDPSCLPTQCTTSPNNPYGSLYPYIYDPTYQEYSNGLSFLDQYGRDVQQIPSGDKLPLTTINVIGDFPNGLYPFFWLMTDYSPQVDNLTGSVSSTSTKITLSADQVHWCVAPASSNSITIPSGYVPPSATTLAKFPDLTQLGSGTFSLPYTCQGPDCCVNFLIDKDPSSNSQTSNTLGVTVGYGPQLTISKPASGASYTAGTSSFTVEGSASEPLPGSISSVNFNISGGNLGASGENLNTKNFTETATQSADVYTLAFSGTINPLPICTDSTPPAALTTGTYSLNVQAIDANGNQANDTVPLNITSKGDTCLSGDTCGTDTCGNSCGPDCGTGYTCTPDSGNPSGGPGTCTSTSGGNAITGHAVVPTNTMGINNPTRISSTPVVSNSGTSSGMSSGTSSVALPKTKKPAPATPSVTLTATDSSGTSYIAFPAGSNIILNAVVSNFSSTQVVFYNNTTDVLGTVLGSGPNYQLTLTNVQNGSYSFTAVAEIAAGSQPTTTANGTIDKVGDPAFIANPALDTSFGEPASSYNTSSDNTWIGGDNQMCTTTWPYNAKSTYLPDGSCELTGTAITTSQGISTPSFNPGVSTMDQLDDVMHTLSDFDKMALSVINNDLGALNSTFDTWYPQIAKYIAPACSSSECTSLGLTAAQCECTESEWDTGSSTCNSKLSCNPGSNGRLLSIYDPYNTLVDILKGWNTLMTKWLGTSYTPSNSTSADVWCVPSKSSLSATGAEYKYIDTNSAVIAGNSAVTRTWGDLPDVLACLNYNAGPTPAQQSTVNYSNYMACLNELSGTCPAEEPDLCAVSILGTTPPATVAPWVSTDTHRCDTYYVDPTTGLQSFANWVSSQINFGPIYNYQNCLNLLTNECPASLAGTVCDASFLGRSLMPAFTGSYTGGKNAPSCNPKTTSSYAYWVKESMDLFIDENSKFMLRSAFLTDIYTRAASMQNIFSSGDVALHDFFKTCSGCADGSTCSGSGSNPGTCATDGSACNAAGCADGGPVAQLMYARTQPTPSQTIPNSVIYGWTDPTLANGGVLPNKPKGAGGYSHIVKVTAYSAGRDGGTSSGSDNAGYMGVQPLLPWVNSWTTFFLQKYALANRDGNVYVSIQRWDQDHNSTVNFPNGHLLWEFLLHNPSSTSSGNGLPSECFSLQPVAGLPAVGFGLENETLQGLKLALSPSDDTTMTLLANAFMLDDNGTGTTDTNIAGDANAALRAQYQSCINDAESLLSTGVESHACARYVADINGGDSSGNGAQDYSLKFIDCNKWDNGNPPKSTP